jgi:scyllo-inositol 2-dehydrogenase (NADP+)
MIRVGVVGFGLAGRIFHAGVVNAVDGLELAAIVQRTGSTAREAYPHVPIFRSVDELLGDRTVRLVVVATPNDSHFPIAKQCLLADRDVVVDKPFALNSAEAAELIQLARTRGRMLSVYHNRRWDGDFRTIRTLLDSGRLGRLVSYESHFDRYRPEPNLSAWRDSGGPGGGILFDLGSHLIDQALVLFGRPNAIWAQVRKEREGARIDDAFDLLLQYQALAPGRRVGDRHDETPQFGAPGSEVPGSSVSGPNVWLRATCIARDPGPRFSLNGTQGTFRKFGLDPQDDRMRTGDIFHSTPWGEDAEELWGVLTENVNGRAVSTRIPTEPGDYRGYYANIRDALLGFARLEVQPVEAWRTMRILEAALESSERGCVLNCDWSREP